MGPLITDADVPKLHQLIKMLPVGTAVAVDTETTGLFPYQSDVLRGVSIAFVNPIRDMEIDSFYLPIGYPDGNLSVENQVILFTALVEREPFLVLHHGKFDFAFLRQLPMGKEGEVFFTFPEPHRWWDTKVVSWLIDENLPTGLKENAAFHWGADEREEQKAVKALVRKVGWGGLTAEQTAPYGAKDAQQTLRLYYLQKRLLDSQDPIVLGDVRPALEREFAIQGVLHRMEQTGILVNPELIESMRVKTAAEVEFIEERFQQRYGVNVASASQLAAFLYGKPMKVRVRETNPETGRERWVLVERKLESSLDLTPPGKTPSGAASTNRAALESLEAKHPEIGQLRELMTHRRLAKALSGYLVPLGERIGYDGRIHPSFSSTGTVTGRFSCSAPNLQTIPRADTLKGVRDVFIAEDGFELWEYDLSAAEMRVVAGLAKEQVLIDSLNEGIDMHGALAAEVFGPNFTGIQRRYAKNVGYGWFYGLTNVKTAAKYIAGDDGEVIARKILDGLKRRYKKVYGLMGRMGRAAEREGYLPVGESWPGRFRRFRTPGRRAPAYTALNARVQGGIGEFMKDVMLMVEAELGQMGARLCLQVHDSLVIEVPEGMGKEVQIILQDAADDLDPFDMRMIFDASPWEAHD